MTMFPTRQERLPENTYHIKYWPCAYGEELTLQEIIDLCARWWPEMNNLSDISIDKEEIQVRCFGYDLYDSSDYRWYWVFRRTD
ncbi:MAG: hypothetical protein EOO61_03285 [Hymenobacter sp.]|nr:MAG: hypothetical protein EOO61_03285 [Hymenobacter sp.]